MRGVRCYTFIYKLSKTFKSCEAGKFSFVFVICKKALPPSQSEKKIGMAVKFN